MGAQEIARALGDRVDALVPHLLQHAVRDGRQWRIGSITGERGKSLAIYRGGDKPGVWRDFALGEGGDALDLVCQVACAGDKAAAVAWAKSWLGVDDGAGRRLHRRTHQRVDAMKEQSSPRSSNGPYRRTKAAPKATQAACDIWRSSVPLWNANARPACLYLASRGIKWPYPEMLAFSRLRHPETGEEDVPSLVVARHCPVVHLVRGIQRIFITDDGQKYPNGTVKMSLGSIAGGRAELMMAGERLAIAEGVESALSAGKLLDVPAWAMCGGFPTAIQLPSIVRSVTLVADHDHSGISEKRARILAAAIREDGRWCRVIMPDQPGMDANDVLLREAS